MRSPRKLALALVALAASLLLALVLAPFLFRDRIAARLKAEINRSVDARVDWGDVGLSLLRDFPQVALRLDDFSVTGVRQFEGDTLASMRRFRLVLDVASLIRHLRNDAPIVVRAVELQQPTVHLRVLEDGTANWDITRADTAAADTTGALAVSLRDFAIRDGTFTLDDRQSDLTASLAGLQQSLSGDFTQDRFVLATDTRVDTVSLRFAGVPYLSRVRLALNADVAADMPERRFTFTKNELRLNDLVLAFSGSVGMEDENLVLGLSFSTPSTAFRDILSLVPAMYTRDFQSLRTSGTMSVAGRVQGEYGPKAFPALALKARVENGVFRYPDLPLPARDIFVDLAIDNPGGHVDSTIVDLKRFHAVVGSQPLDARLMMRTPVSDPDVDLRLVGTLNLADVRRTMKLDNVDELAGVIAADIAMRARKSHVDAGQYDRVAARGTVDVARFTLRSATLPQALMVDTALLRLTPRRAELASFTGRIGRSDLRATGSLENLLGFMLRDEVLRGQAKVSSNHFDLNEWRSDEEETEVILVPPNIDFSLQASAARVAYGKLAIANARGGLRVKDQRVTLDDFRMDMLGGSVVASGFYETTIPTRPTFDLDLRVESVDIPTAFASLVTVQKLAPVARYTRGAFSADLDLMGPLGRDMLPVLEALTGRGSLKTSRLALQDFPVTEKLADALKIEQLRNPALEAVRSSIEIIDGRLHVKPFDVKVGQVAMKVAGSNGIDQSLQYNLAFAVPRAALGAGADRVIAGLAAQAGKAGLDLGAAQVVELGAQVTGTVTNPTIKPNFSGVVTSVREGVQQAVRKQVESRVADVKERADSAAEGARRRAKAEADRIVAEAEQRAATIREEARTLANTVRSEGHGRADALLEQATNPVARLAAQAGADRLRREADEQADRVVREADARADEVVEQAKRQAAAALVQPER